MLHALTPEQRAEALQHIATLRGLYKDLAGDHTNFQHQRELWAQVDVEQAALATLMPRAWEQIGAAER